MACCNDVTRSILSDFFMPEVFVYCKLRQVQCLQGRPVVCALVDGSSVVLSTVISLIKPFVLPIMAALGLLWMPIRAFISAVRGDPATAKGYLKGLGVCFIILVGSAAYLSLVGFQFSFLSISLSLVLILAISIVYHVRTILLVVVRNRNAAKPALTA